MDQPGLDPAHHRQALRALQTVNRISRTGPILWAPIRRLLRTDPARTWRVLDVGSGGGDIVLSLAASARQENLSLAIDGCDISPLAVAHATQRAAEFVTSQPPSRPALSLTTPAHSSTEQPADRDTTAQPVRFFEHDVLRDELPQGYDIVLCSLFLHHLDDFEARKLLINMGRSARRMVLVDDLCRSSWGYLVAWLGGRLVSRSHIVHNDGPISVEAAFTMTEARQLALDAGLAGASIRPHWPARYLLTWERP